MSRLKSAKKRTRQSARRRLSNRRRKAGVKESVRSFETALAAGRTEQAAGELKTVYKRLDKIATKGTIHKNAAARKKSRLAKRLAASSS